MDLSPKVIAHRSSYTRGELLINPSAYKSFKQKVHIVDKVTVPRGYLKRVRHTLLTLSTFPSPDAPHGHVHVKA